MGVINERLAAMADKNPSEKEAVKDDQPQEQPREHQEHHHPHPPHPPFGGQIVYGEMARIVTTLFVGVLALMTFLLTIGVQRPHGQFQMALYTSVVILPLNLLIYMFGHLFAMQVKEDGAESGRKRLRMVRYAQQLLFVLAILSVAWLAYAVAQFFFALPANPMGAQSQ